MTLKNILLAVCIASTTSIYAQIEEPKDTVYEKEAGELNEVGFFLSHSTENSVFFSNIPIANAIFK